MIHTARAAVVVVSAAMGLLTTDVVATLALWVPLGIVVAVTALGHHHWHHRLAPVWAVDLFALGAIRVVVDVSVAGEPILALFLVPVVAGVMAGVVGVGATIVVVGASMLVAPPGAGGAEDVVVAVLVLSACAFAGHLLQEVESRERRRLVEETARSRRLEAVLSTVVRSDPRGIVVRDETGHVVEINEAACRLLDVTAANFLDFASGSRTIPGRLLDEDGEALTGTLPTELANRTGDVVTEQVVGIERPGGDPQWLAISAIPVETADGRWVVTQLRDITAETSTLSRLQRQAALDPLTGIGNRRLLEWTIDDIDDEDEQVAVVMLDLDDFKDVNDTLGHDVGDEVLRELADRLLGACRPDDLVLRLGGDEFAAVLRSVDDPDVDRIVRRIEGALAAPYSTAAGGISVGCSVGHVTGVAGLLRTLLRDADALMYRTKRDVRRDAIRRHPSNH